jgi:uncharacterized protein (DUF1800 family)
MPATHDLGAKVVLGHKIKSGGGITDGEQVLDIVAEHPSTARHIATKLARRFVSDDPPESLVARVAARFLETHGNLREVVRAVITSDEFFAAEARRAKVKTPPSSSSARSGHRHDTIEPRRGRRTAAARHAALWVRTADRLRRHRGSVISAGALVTRMNIAQMIAGRRVQRIGGPTSRGGDNYGDHDASLLNPAR